MNLPPQYRYLQYEPSPRMLREALTLYGIEEIIGPGDNPFITAWAKEVGAKGYVHDATPWCGLFASVVAKRAGWDFNPGGNMLWALNWAKWGTPQKVAMLGDILVYERAGGGHVTQYVGEDSAYYHCLGGNQSDRANIVRKPKSPIKAIRRAPWKIRQPDNVRRIWLDATGPISVNEA